MSKRFSLFRKRSIKTNSKSTIDDTNFDFQIIGGQDHTKAIEAIATNTKGKKINLPLKCTWYRSTCKVDLKVIEDVTSAVYHPTLDDVGCKISVHAVPAVEEYSGMPLFREIGPIALNPEMEAEAVAQLRSNKAQFTVWGNDSLEAGSISFQDNAVIYRGKSVRINNVYLASSTSITLVLEDSESLKLRAENSSDRDMIAILIRMYNGLEIVSTDSLCLYLKVDQLSSAIKMLCREKEDLLQQVNLLSAGAFPGSNGAPDPAMLLKEISLYKEQLQELETSKQKNEAKDESQSTTSEVSAPELIEIEEQLRSQNEQITKYKSQIESQKQQIDQLTTQIKDQKPATVALSENGLHLSDENIQLRQQVYTYQITLKRSNEQLESALLSQCRCRKTSLDNSEQMQALVNILTQKLTDKDTEIDVQKNVNRQLMAQINELTNAV